MTEQELKIDIEYLVNRQIKSNGLHFTDDRETGLSSNSIVAIAYGVYTLENQILPGDHSDLRSCEKMWLGLPAHRKNEQAIEAMNRARSSLS